MQPNAGAKEFKPNPNGSPVPRAQLLGLMALWREEADRLIAQADPRPRGKVARTPVATSSRIEVLERALRDAEEAKGRAEKLAQARALLTIRRDVLDLMR